MDLNALVDRLTPAEGSRFDELSAGSHAAVSDAFASPAGRPVWAALHGNTWVGHPLHPVVVTVPIGVWCATAWFDARSAAGGDPRDEHAADATLRLGVAGALGAALTGLAQYVDTRGAVRRETTVHAALNSTALALYLASWAARRRGRRPLGRRLAAVALGVVGVSGFLGGDISYRHGVGVRPQALRDLHEEAPASSDEPILASGSVHS